MVGGRPPKPPNLSVDFVKITHPPRVLAFGSVLAFGPVLAFGTPPADQRPAVTSEFPTLGRYQ